MLKKAIHHASRTVVVCFEIAGVLALLLFLGWVGLIWRLSQGPLAVNDYLTHKVERAFTEQLPDFAFTIGGAELIWGGRFQPFELEIKDVHITRSEGTRVLDVKKLRVQLSKRSLAFGRIVPRVIKVYGPTLRVIRLEDGRFTLNVGEEVAKDANVPVPAEVIGPPAPVAEGREALVKGFLSQLQEHSGLGILDRLHEIEVSDAAVLYEDRVLGVAWKSLDSDVVATRGDHGIVSTAMVSLDIDKTHKAALQAQLTYDWDVKKTTALIAFSGLVPARIAQASEKLKDMTGINVPLVGSLSLDLDPDFRPEELRFTMGGEAGTFNALDLFPQPITVKSLFLRGKMEAKSGITLIDQLKLDMGGPVINAGLKVETSGTARNIAFVGTMTDMPIDWLKNYWPQPLTPAPRDWVVKHLSKGTATTATVDLEGVYDPTAEHHFVENKIEGKIDFNGVTVDYLPPLPVVEDVSGTATYDRASFNIALKGGKLGDLTAGKSTVAITGLDKTAIAPGIIDINLNVKGPLKSALQVIDAEPLKYPTKLGLDITDVAGKAEAALEFKFPIHKGLTIHEVTFGVKGKLDDVMLRHVAAGMDLSGGPMDLTLDNDSLDVKGKGRLDSMPVDFDWRKYFAADAPVATRLSADIDLNAAALKKFGVPEDLRVTGSLPSEVVYTQKPDKTAALALQGNIKQLGFTMGPLGYVKEEGREGTLDLSLALKNNHVQQLTGLALKAPGMSVRGDLKFGDNDGLQSANLSEISFGATSVSADIENKGKDGYIVKVRGGQLDASSLFKPADNTPQSDAEAAKQVAPLRMTLDVRKLITGPDRALENVTASLARTSWGRLDQLDLEATSGKKKLSVLYGPQGKGHSLKFVAENAGEALSALGISKSIRGGRLTIDGRPRPSGPRDMAGTAILTDFKMNDAPVVAKLVNAMSLPGIIGLLNGEGLSFKKARVDFSWTDKGPPTQTANMRLLSLKNGQTSGASLGLSFEGNIDNWKNIYDLHGTIVPVSDLNKFLNIIPIIGTVLTAGGEGIIAATYTVTGPKSQPDVMVNPLSVLAPGILRKIFFEN